MGGVGQHPGHGQRALARASDGSWWPVGEAGLAAVYNVPIGGAIFTAETLWAASPSGRAPRPGVLVDRHGHGVGIPARARPLCRHPRVPVQYVIMVWAVLVGPVVGVISAGFIRLVGWNLPPPVPPGPDPGAMPSRSASWA